MGGMVKFVSRAYASQTFRSKIGKVVSLSSLTCVNLPAPNHPKVEMELASEDAGSSDPDAPPGREETKQEAEGREPDPHHVDKDGRHCVALCSPLVAAVDWPWRACTDDWFPRKLLKSRPFQTFINICILGNMVVLGMASHGMSDEKERALETANTLFSFVFIVEMVFKIAVLGPARYLSQLTNVVDFIIVSGSIVEMIMVSQTEMTEDSGISALRGFRLLRLVRALRAARLGRLATQSHAITQVARSLAESFEAETKMNQNSTMKSRLHFIQTEGKVHAFCS